MSNVFELLVLITSHLPWCVLPFFGVQPLTPLRALKSVPFSGPPQRPEATNSATNTSLEVFAQHFIQVTLPRWPFDSFPPPRGNRFGWFFFKGERWWKTFYRNRRGGPQNSRGVYEWKLWKGFLWNWNQLFATCFAGWGFNSRWTKLFSLLILHMSKPIKCPLSFFDLWFALLIFIFIRHYFPFKHRKGQEIQMQKKTLQMQQIHCSSQHIWISDDHRKSSTFRDVSLCRLDLPSPL